MRTKRPPGSGLRWSILLGLWGAILLGASSRAVAAQRAFFIFQSSDTETVPAGTVTNFTVTLTYSNASGTINNAVFTNSVTVAPVCAVPGRVGSLSRA